MASCQQPSRQPPSRSRHSPEPLLHGVLPTTISPDGVSIPTLTRAPTALRLANSHLTSWRPNARQSHYCVASCRQPSRQTSSRSRRLPQLLLRCVLPTAISPAGVLTLTRAPTARRLADSHPATQCLDPDTHQSKVGNSTTRRLADSHPASRSLDRDAHQSSYCAASCQQPSRQPPSRSRCSPEPLMRGVLPTTISPAGVSILTLTRVPTSLRLANSHLTSRRLDAHQSSYCAASCRQPSRQPASRPRRSSELGR